MQQDDFRRFRSIMTGMAKLYGGELDAPTLDAYWLALRTWALADFEAGAAQLMRTSKFMPRPADFGELRRAGLATAGEAWAEARTCWRRGGSGTGDALTDRVVQMLGGYRAMGMMSTDQMPFLERRFAEHYESLRDAEEIRDAVPQITAARGPIRLNGPTSARRLLGRPDEQP